MVIYLYIEEMSMPLIGIVAKKKDIQAIKRKLNTMNCDIIEINKESINNLKHIKFDEIIFLQGINLQDKEYKCMREIISKVQYLVINADIGIETLKEIEIEKPIKLITFGFNSKATITISSVKEQKIIVCVQRNIETINKKIIESQEKEIIINNIKSEKIYNELVVFIIKELHNL